MKNQYRTGVKSRELILSKVKEHGQPVDVATLSALAGLQKNNINHMVTAMCKLGSLYVHHYERTSQGNQKPVYWTEVCPFGVKRLVRLMGD